MTKYTGWQLRTASGRPVPCAATVLLMCLLPFNAASGELINVVNPSFESPTALPGQFVGSINAAPAGWTVYNTGATNNLRFFGVINTNSTALYYDPVPDGNNIGVVFLQNQTNIAEAGLRQTLTGSVLQANTRYELQVEVGNMAPNSVNYNFTGFPGYRVELLAGNTVVAVDNNSLLPDEGRYLRTTVVLETGNLHANLSQTLGIRLVNLNGPGIEVNFDDVRLDAVAVPEPSSFALMGGVAAAWWVKRRRRKLTALRDLTPAPLAAA